METLETEKSFSQKQIPSNDDDLPKNICVECFEKLQQFYQFRVQIEKSDEVLRHSKGMSASSAPDSKLEETVDSCEYKAGIDENTESTACVVCQKIFRDAKRMQIHLIRKHSVRNDQNIGKEYKCNDCDKTYSTRANLTLHERTHFGKLSSTYLIALAMIVPLEGRSTRGKLSFLISLNRFEAIRMYCVRSWFL